MKKVLCICNHGNVRSASMKYVFWRLNGPCGGTDEEYLKEYIKYESIAVGAHCTSDETIKMLIDWADIVIDLSDNDKNIQPKLMEMAKEKYYREDIGGDIWHNPFHEDLVKITKKIRNKHAPKSKK